MQKQAITIALRRRYAHDRPAGLAWRRSFHVLDDPVDLASAACGHLVSKIRSDSGSTTSDMLPIFPLASHQLSPLNFLTLKKLGPRRKSVGNFEDCWRCHEQYGS